LEQVEVRTVSATLGEEALGNAVKAGIIGLILVLLFMLLVYRIQGLIADFALLGYLAIVFIILANCHINLTLPGIAGIILSVGMAVDANVVIFERVKEELKLGKTVRSAVDAGFNRALSAVVDSNITTIISAVILWVFGTGTIKGFGITLFIGIVVSMISAIFVTKFLLKQTIGMNIKNVWLFGVNKKKNVEELKGGKA
jgi:protein-export membrane protein SecD